MNRQHNKPIKILFVCLGNICRSPAAQGVMERLIKERGLENDFIIDSAGTYGGHSGDLPDRRMRTHALRRGYNLTHRSRRIAGRDFENSDIIVAMDNGNISTLKSMAASTEEEQKIVPMAKFLKLHPHNDHIPDPYYEGSEGFELVLDLLEDACLNLLETLLASERSAIQPSDNHI